MYSFSKKDEKFMQRALEIARKAEGWTNPNPLVGVVLVKSGHILSEGFHKKFGQPHAEIEALRSAKINPAGATLFVNLEPCCYTDKTPPCTEAIIKAKIAQVICAMPDPNPRVSGEGINQLKAAGVRVDVGLLEKEATLLNETFITFYRKKRPFIALKFAASLDGKIATKTGDSKWITNEKSRLFARQLRARYQAVLVGINTVLKDDPHLGTRIKGKKDPIRIILDSKLKVPLSSKVLRDNNVIIATTKRSDREKAKLLSKIGVALLECDEEKIPIKLLIRNLAKRNIISILVEGGGKVLGSFVDEKMVDKIYAFHAPVIIGGKLATPAISGEGAPTVKQSLHLRGVTFKKFGSDMLTIGYV